MAKSYKSKKEKLNKEMRPMLEKELTKKFDYFRNQGVAMGWNAFAIQAIENIKNMTTIDEVMTYFQTEANKTKAKLGLDLSIGNDKKA